MASQWFLTFCLQQAPVGVAIYDIVTMALSALNCSQFDASNKLLSLKFDKLLEF